MNRDKVLTIFDKLLKEHTELVEWTCRVHHTPDGEAIVLARFNRRMKRLRKKLTDELETARRGGW